MNAGFIPMVVMGFIGYLIAITIMPHVITENTYIHNAGICVVSTAPVQITTPVIDHNGNDYCKVGTLVRTLPNGS